MITISRTDAAIKSRFRFHPDENLCAVVIEGPDTDLIYAVAAAIRRTAIDEIPYPALSPTEAATFAINTTIFNNEFVWLRMGLIPLSMKTGQVERRLRGTRNEEFKWLHGAPEFTLDAQGQDRNIVVVRSKPHLVRAERGSETELSIEPDPVTGDYPPLVKLQPGEQLSVTIRATVATGREHAGHSPVGTVSYEIQTPSASADSAVARVLMVFEFNNAKEPSAEQHVYDTLYWARRRLLDLACKLSGKGDCGDAAVVTVDRNMNPHAVVVTVEGETETRAMVVTNDLRTSKMGEDAELGFMAHRVPLPLEQKIEFRLQPSTRKAEELGDGDEPLKKWGASTIHTGVLRGAERYARLLRKWGEATGIAAPTVRDRVHTDND